MITNIDYFTEQFKKGLDEEIARVAMNMASGSCGNFDNYREMVGYCRALAFSVELAKELKTKTDSVTGN